MLREKASDVQISLSAVFLAHQRELDHISQQFSQHVLPKRDGEKVPRDQEVLILSNGHSSSVWQRSPANTQHTERAATKGLGSPPGPCRGYNYNWPVWESSVAADVLTLCPGRNLALGRLAEVRVWKPKCLLLPRRSHSRRGGLDKRLWWVRETCSPWRRPLCSATPGHSQECGPWMAEAFDSSKTLITPFLYYVYVCSCVYAHICVNACEQVHAGETEVSFLHRSSGSAHFVLETVCLSLAISLEL